MNRQEFLRQLAQLLEDIPEAERREALEYYNNYFDDAVQPRSSRNWAATPKRLPQA